MRVVLYAEGGREDARSLSLLPRPGVPLTEPALGPGHIIIRRRLGEYVPESTIQFEAPLRARGRLARGSQLKHSSTLRKLVTWALPTQMPDVAIVLIDSDGDPDCASRVRGFLEGRPDPQPEVILGVAAHEFESWLIADEAALRDCLGYSADALVESDNLEPGKAKRLIDGLVRSQAAGLEEEKRLRVALAARIDLQTTADRNRSFAKFRAELHALVKRL